MSCRCAASSVTISALVASGRFIEPSRSRINLLQSGMVHPHQLVQRVKEATPLLAQRCQLLLTCCCQAIVAAVTAGIVGLPVPCDPAVLFQLVKHGIERGQCEAESATGSIFDLLGDFKAVQGLLGQQGQDGNLSAASGYYGADTFHAYEYRIPIFISQPTL